MCQLVTGTVLLLMILAFALSLVANTAVMTVGSLLSSMAGLFAFFIVCYARVTVREREGIRGSGLGDCFASLCCTPCSMAQLLNQYPPFKTFWYTYDPLYPEGGKGAAVDDADDDAKTPLAIAV